MVLDLTKRELLCSITGGQRVDSLTVRRVPTIAHYEILLPWAAKKQWYLLQMYNERERAVRADMDCVIM